MRSFLLLIGSFLIAGIDSFAQPKLIMPLGHAEAISDCRFSPDGKIVVTNGGEEKNVKIWETRTGKLLATFDHADKVTSVTFSPDGKYLLTTGHDHHAKVWDIRKGSLYYDINFYFSNWVEKGFFTADGKKILLMGNDAMEYHDLQKKQLIHNIYDTTAYVVYAGQKTLVSFVKYDATQEFALTTNADSSLTVWDLASGKVLHKIKEAGVRFIDCRITAAADKFLATSSDDKVRIWETRTGKLLQEISTGKNLALSATFTPAENSIIVCSIDSNIKTNEKAITNCRVELWDFAANQLLQTYHLPENVATISSVVSPDGNSLLTLSSDGIIRLWETKSGKFIRKVAQMIKDYSPDIISINPDDLEYLNAAFSADSKYIVASPMDNTASVQETKSGRLIAKLEGISTMIYNPVYSPDGKFLATIGLKKNIRTNEKPEGAVSIWDLATGKLIHSLTEHTAPVNEVVYSHSGKYLASASEDSTVKLWDAATGKLFRTLGPHEKGVYACYFSGDDHYLVTQTFFGRIRIWNIESKQLIATIQHDSATAEKFGAYRVTMSATGKYFMSEFYDDNRIRVTETATGKTLSNFTPLKDSLSNLLFDPHEKFFVCYGKKGIVLKDISNGRDLLVIQPGAALASAKLNPAGNILAGIALDSTIKFWELPTGKRLGTIRPAKKKYTELEFTVDGKYLLSYNYDTLVRVWDMATLQMIRSFPIGGNDYLEFNLIRENKHFLFTNSMEGFMKIWNLETGEMITSVLDKFNSNLRYTIHPLLPQFVIDNKFYAEIYTFGSSLPLLKIVPAGVSEYLVIDSTNRYDGTEEARKLLYFACGTELVELDQVKDQLWVPDLAERTMKGETINAKTLNQLDICGLTPRVDDKEDEAGYHFMITPGRGGLGDVVLYINGIEAARYNKSQLTRSGEVYNLDVKKPEIQNYFVSGQENQVSLRAFTVDNTISSRGTKIISKSEKPPAVPPNLFAVMVGISDYKGDELDLKYAAKDATDISNAVAVAARKLLNTDGGEHVFMYNLTTAKERYQLPEKNSIKKIFEEIGKKANANDILLIFFAGHGVMWGEADDKQFYFLSADASSLSAGSAVKEVGISTRELTEWMKPGNIKAQKRVLIFDACNSGQAIKDFVKVGTNDQNYLAARNDDKSQQIKAIDKLNEKAGLFILSASASNQSAYEMGRYAQGLLTYSLLKAIKEQPDILEDGKYLNVGRWFNAAERTVSDIARESGARQEPQVVTNSNFNIGIVDDEVTARINLPEEKPLFAASNFQNNDESVADDDLELSKLINLQLNEIASRGADSKIVYVTATNSPDAYTLTGRYEINGNGITVKVNVKQHKEIKYRFDQTGTKDKLKELAAAIAGRAAESVK